MTRCDIAFREGNTIEFLPNGIYSYARRWELIEHAQHSIHIVTFSFMKDETTRKLLDLLKKKLSEGVAVRVIYDDIVNKTTFVGKWLKDLEQHGAVLMNYNALNTGWFIKKGLGHPFKQFMMNVKLKLKQHFHEKYMIVDNTHLVLGGINWGDKYAFGGEKPKAWRDTDVYITGPVVHDVQMQFLRDFEMQRNWKKLKKVRYQDFVLDYMPRYQDTDAVRTLYSDVLQQYTAVNTAGSCKIAYVVHKPYDANTLPLTNTFLRLIAGAEKRIYWGCHGIRPPRIYFEYLAAAVKRGVEVVLITNSKKSAKTLMVNGLMGWMYWECTKHYLYLLEHGVRVFEWQKPGAFHSKNLVIDDHITSVGSYNIANGSSFHHSESNVIIDDTAFCEKVFAQFEKDLLDCLEITLNDFKPRAPKVNAFNRILHERNKMIDAELQTDSIRQDLQKGNFKQFPLYEFVDIS